MPGYKLHLAFGGAVVGAALVGAQHFSLVQVNPLVAALLICVGLIFSLFPDVDTDSKGQHFFYGLLAIVNLGLMWKGEYKWAAILGFAALLPAISRHRGFTHRWWAALLIPALVAAVPMCFYATSWQVLLPWYAAAVLGYCSHILLDSLA